MSMVILAAIALLLFGFVWRNGFAFFVVAIIMLLDYLH
jgi:hypothetical protein